MLIIGVLSPLKKSLNYLSNQYISESEKFHLPFIANVNADTSHLEKETAVLWSTVFPSLLEESNVN